MPAEAGDTVLDAEAGELLAKVAAYDLKAVNPHTEEAGQDLNSRPSGYELQSCIRYNGPSDESKKHHRFIICDALE